jgi:hypothetical protein
VTWFHTDFLARHLPILIKKLDKKQLALPKAARENFLQDKSQKLTR